MADLGVKPAIAAVAVMPVLCLVLQPVREGVCALEDMEHARRGEEAPLPRRTGVMARGGFLTFSWPQRSRGSYSGYRGCDD